MTFDEVLRQRMEASEHAVLAARTWQEWGHDERCRTCLDLRTAAGENTKRDYLLRDPQGRPLIPWRPQAKRDAPDA